MMSRHILLWAVLFLCVSAPAQDASGTWQGASTNSGQDIHALRGVTYEYLLRIAADGTTITGTVVMTLTSDEGTAGLKREHTVTGTWDGRTGLMALQVQGFREVRINRSGVVMNGQSTIYKMKLREKKKEWILEGRQVTDTVKVAIFPATLRLVKKKEPLPPVNAAPLLPAGAQPAFDERTTDTLQTLELDSSVITMELYDNGEVDGDTVSVFLNNRLLIYKQLLSSKAFTLDVKLDTATAVHELKMYAENLGSIPPNTAVMIIRQGNRRYEAALSADLKKNGAVLLRLKK